MFIPRVTKMIVFMYLDFLKVFRDWKCLRVDERAEHLA